jgi:hypothetical protein
VETVLTTPGEHHHRRRRVDEGPRLEAIRQAIVKTPLGQARQIRRPGLLPRLVNLDPQAELPGRSERLSRLIRETFAEPSLLRGEPLDQVCARVGRRQTPEANSTLIDLAVRSLETWPDSTLFEELRGASLSRKAIERGLRWKLSDVLESEKACVIQGSCDAVYRDRRGRWRPVIASTDQSRYKADRLRILFSELAIARCGLRPAGPAWWICFKDDGRIDVDIHMRLSPSAIEQAVVLWLEQSAGRVRGDP